MRLTDLYLDGFGHFHQQAIGPVTRPVTVFYGPNEAGKSTLLAFIRTVLFGFPSQHRRHYPPLSGGQHGGRIRLAEDSGEIYTLERHAGPRGGSVTVRSDAGETLDAATFLPRLTGNATPDLFRNVFAFSLDELQNEGLMNDAGVANRIYGAGLGVSRLHDLSQSLSRAKREIFLPTGQQQKIADSLRDLQRVDGQLRDIEGNAALYGSLTARKAEIDEELQDADDELSRLASQRAGIDRLLEGRDDWLALSDCDSQLRDMPRYVDFPENPIVRLDGFESQIRQLREDRDEAAGHLRRAEAEASAAVPGEDLLYDRERIEAMRRDRNRFDAAVRDLPERQGELRGMEADFAEHLSDLGHDWGEAELLAFDTSLVVRNQVDTWKERLTETGDRARQARIQLAQEQRSLVDHQAATQEAQDTLPPDPPLNAAALSERQDALRAARGRLAEYERQRQSHETLRGQLNALAASQETPGRDSSRIGLLPIIGLVLAGAVLAVGGILLGGGALLLGILCGVVLLLAATMLWFMSRPAPSDAPSPMATTLAQQATGAERAEEIARQALVTAAASLGLRAQPDAAALDTAEERVNLARNALNARNAGNTRLEDATRRERTQRQRLDQAVQENETAQAMARQAQQEWLRWLGERGLDETLTPDAMTAFLARVETACGNLAETGRMRDRVAAIEHDIQEFRELVEPLAQRHGIALDAGDRRQLAVVADELIQRLDDAQTAFSERERASDQVDENRELLAAWERRLQSAEEELAGLLSAGGTDDAEEFRRRARQHGERLELERKRDEHRRGLERMSGAGKDFDDFCSLLGSSDPEHLQDESARLWELQAQVSSHRDGLREERGGIDNELAQLSGEEESSALRVRRHTLEEQLREHAREWSRLTIAEELLTRTRQKFEEERQPSVIRHAQEFFRSVTGGRYQRLYAPIGQQTVTVTDATGASKQPAELSRGTREQLYLALRFGLIREFGEHAERLPVVVDEALVNFDPERARLAAESFGRLAETNQVLVFTCHPATAEMFAEAAGAQVVDISR